MTVSINHGGKEGYARVALITIIGAMKSRRVRGSFAFVAAIRKRRLNQSGSEAHTDKMYACDTTPGRGIAL